MKEKYYSKKHCWGSRLVSLLALIMLSTSLYADGNVIITKLLNGTEYSGPDQVTYSNGVITAIPSLGNYIDKSHRVNTKKEAMEIGRACKQISVLNWKNMSLAYC